MTNSVETIGRNEPCPCRSGKKYKRCCGVNAAPKITPPKNPVPEGAPSDPASALGNMDPQMMTQFAQSLQRLPKGQLQRLQVIMQKAMSGKDVTAESKEFERSLPLDLQTLIHSMAPMMAGGLPGMGTPPQLEQPMTEEEARALVAQAATEGTITKEKAEALLQPAGVVAEIVPAESPTAAPSKLGKLWQNLAGKKN